MIILNFVCCKISFQIISLIYVLEELLIDFQELIGAHSGANMVEAIWDTIVLYGLEGRVS